MYAIIFLTRNVLEYWWKLEVDAAVQCHALRVESQNVVEGTVSEYVLGRNYSLDGRNKYSTR